MIFLQDGLIEFFISQGASKALAEDLATELADKLARAIERERREQDIADLFARTKLSCAGIAQRVRCHKSTVSRVIRKSVA